jgi:hypothetical protein
MGDIRKPQNMKGGFKQLKGKEPIDGRPSRWVRESERDFERNAS